MEVLVIVEWDKRLQVSQSKRVKGSFSWLPRQQDYKTREYKRIVCSEHARSALGAWYAIAQLAADMPVHGVLMDEKGPLDSEDIAYEIGFQPEWVEEALKILQDPKINYLEKIQISDLPKYLNNNGLDFNNARRTLGSYSEEARSILGACSERARSVLGPEIENEREIREEEIPPTPHGGAEGGGDPSPAVPDCLTEEAEELRQEILASNMVRKGQLEPEAWALILRRCPDFDPADLAMREGLMSHVLCMDKKINGPASWFPNKMGLVTKGAAPEEDPEDYPNFQAWFEEYPKGARHPAFRMWVELGMESRDLPELLRVLKAQKASEEWEDVKFVQDAKNYLRDRLFDEPLPEKNKGGRSSVDDRRFEIL